MRSRTETGGSSRSARSKADRGASSRAAFSGADAGACIASTPISGRAPWFGLAPHKRTLQAFEHCIAHCGLTEWVQVHLGDSASVAAVWPAEPIDAVLIDGDHSYLGVLADFECWAAKVRPGGLILFDDVGGTKTELNELIAHLQAPKSVTSLGAVGEIAAFRRAETSPWELLAELSGLLATRRVTRPWDVAPLHATHAPANFRAAPRVAERRHRRGVHGRLLRPLRRGAVRLHRRDAIS